MAVEFALIVSSPDEPRTRHYIGGGLAPTASVVVLAVKDDGVFLFRYAADASFVGDTWHANVADARDQAAFEYGASLGEWSDVPFGVEDAAQYALARLPVE